MMQRVAVIGAGPSGLSLLRAFQAAEEKGVDIPEVVCFEKQGEAGGLWNFCEATGEDVHGSMYKDLHTNGPKEINEYPDYSFLEHFRKPIGSYPPRAVIESYIKGRAEKYSLCERFVRFHTNVCSVTYSEDRSVFAVTVKHSGEQRDREYCEEFHHVVVATGHFSTPNVPHFQGLEGFGGTVLHSHDLRDLSKFRGTDVLLIGSGYSAEDIALVCHKFGASSITISYRTNPTGCSNWPESIKEVPLLERVDPNGRTCHFRDGTSKEFDAIILCTGYLHHFPFLPENLRLVTTNRLWPLGLYKGVVGETDPLIYYLGMQAQFYSFIMFDAQAWYVRDVILGRVKLPSMEEMKAHSEKWRVAEAEVLASRGVKAFQGNYLKELISETDCPVTPDLIDRTLLMGLDWDKHKAHDILSYRDHPFVSAVTESKAEERAVAWMGEFDDSLYHYLNPT